jgi:hypothetical protein
MLGRGGWVHVMPSIILAVVPFWLRAGIDVCHRTSLCTAILTARQILQAIRGLDQGLNASSSEGMSRFSLPSGAR